MIRVAKASDADEIASIYNHYILNTVITFEESTVSGAAMALRIDKVGARGLPWLIAEDDNGIVGYAYATAWNDRSAYNRTVEVSVYISHTSLSRGWGTVLYQSLFDELTRSDIHVIIGGIALPNAASVALHEKLGMEKVAHFSEVGFKFGEWIDVGYWQVNL